MKTISGKGSIFFGGKRGLPLFFVPLIFSARGRVPWESLPLRDLVEATSFVFYSLSFDFL